MVTELRNPTPAQRAAADMLHRLYVRDTDARKELGIPLPHDHRAICVALRDLDRMVGFRTEADDDTMPPGEGLHRWAWHHAADVAPLDQAALFDGSDLADHLIRAAVWRLSDETAPEIVERIVDAHIGGPRGVVPRG